MRSRLNGVQVKCFTRKLGGTNTGANYDVIQEGDEGDKGHMR